MEYREYFCKKCSYRTCSATMMRNHYTTCKNDKKVKQENMWDLINKTYFTKGKA